MNHKPYHHIKELVESHKGKPVDKHESGHNDGKKLKSSQFGSSKLVATKSPTPFDPAIMGPGIWYRIHIDALAAVTDELKASYIVYINNLCDKFNCKKCQEHFREYLDDNSFESYWRMENGFFKWTWAFHNAVNKRLGKREYSYEECLGMYSGSVVCVNCGNNFGNDLGNGKGNHTDIKFEKQQFEKEGYRKESERDKVMEYDKTIPEILEEYIASRRDQREGKEVRGRFKKYK